MKIYRLYSMKNVHISYLVLSLSCAPTFFFFSSGDGKTHYIQQQLATTSDSVTVTVNEAFTSLNTIHKLCKLPLKKNCAIFFNFTMLPPGVRREKRSEREGKVVWRYSFVVFREGQIF